MTTIEKVLLSTDDEINDYLGDVLVADFKHDIKEFRDTFTDKGAIVQAIEMLKGLL